MKCHNKSRRSYINVVIIYYPGFFLVYGSDCDIYSKDDRNRDGAKL